MKDKIIELINSEKTILKRLKKEYQNLPDGKLYVRKVNSNYYFTHYSNGRQTGINKNMELVYELARKTYVNLILKEKEHNIQVLEKAVYKLYKNDKSNIFNMLDHEKVIYSNATRKWIENNKSQNPYLPELLKYSTKNGVKMRSKSERTIGNFLEENGIPYLYEAAIEINGRLLYPDFVILKPDGTILIWEHFGLMDDPEYAQKNFYKLEEYRRAGYLQHSNLICTYEEDLEDPSTLKKILYRFM